MKRTLALAGAGLVVALQLVAIERQSVTTDEAYHLYAGFAALRYGTNAYNLEHPPLVKLLAAWPLTLEPEPYAPPVAMADAIRTGERLFEPAEDAHRRIRCARLIVLALFALPLVGCCAVLGWRWSDPPTGVLAALAVGLSMATLPYLSLVIHDAPVALGFVLVLLAADRFLRRPGWAAAIPLGLAWGLAMSVKFSGVLAGVAVATALVLAPPTAAGWRSLARRAGAAALAAAAAAVVVLGAYRAANTGYDAQLGRRSIVAYARGASGLIVEDRLRPWEPRLLALERISPGAAQWLAGLLTVAAQSSIGGLPSYAFGTVTSYGRWWYFPALLAVKTPLAILVSGFGAAVLAVRRLRARPPPGDLESRDERRLRRSRWVLAALTAGVYLTAAIGSSYNLGIRHLLPILPLLYLPAAWAAARRPLTAAAFAALLALEALALTPRWMSATSTWWLGAADPVRFALSAGDLDYHQNLRLLARDLERRGIDDVTVAHPLLGARRLGAYLPGAALADPDEPPAPGWHAVSVTLEQYVPALLAAPAEEIYGHQRFRAFAERWEPYLGGLRDGAEDHGWAGATFHLYRVPPRRAPRPDR